MSCVVQFGGQTPLKLALSLQEAGVTILGTSPDSIDLAEDRQRFSQLLWDLGIPQPASGTATSRAEAREVAARIGFPVVVRPSYVLGGRTMAIVYDVATLDRYMTTAVDVSHDHPILIDQFLEDAFEFDVDCVADATGAVVIGGIMEHIEEAGIHSGDSSCVVPPHGVAEQHLATIRDYTRRIARALKVVGLMNVQYAIKDDTVYVLEVNPARVAHGAVPVEGHRRAAGEGGRARDGGPDAGRARAGRGPGAGRRVREEPGVPVRPLPRRRHDSRARDEVHRRGDGRRRQLRHGLREGDAGRRAAAAGVGHRVHQREQRRQGRRRCRLRASWRNSGSSIAGTRGTAAYLRAHGIDASVVYKVNEGRPNLADEIVNSKIALVINTPLGRESFFDDKAVRRAAMMNSVPCITTLTGAAAAVQAIRALRTEALDVRALQDYHATVSAESA